MFVYCLWSGDRYENTRILLAHQNNYSPEEFKAICDKARKKLIDNTSKNHEIMDTTDGVKSIWEYATDDELLKDLKSLLVEEYGFHEIGVLNNYHVHSVDPYDYGLKRMFNKQISKINSRSYVQNYKNKIENGENNLNIYHVPKTPKRK